MAQVLADWVQYSVVAMDQITTPNFLHLDTLPKFNTKVEQLKAFDIFVLSCLPLIDVVKPSGTSVYNGRLNSKFMMSVHQGKCDSDADPTKSTMSRSSKCHVFIVDGTICRTWLDVCAALVPTASAGTTHVITLIEQFEYDGMLYPYGDGDIIRMLKPYFYALHPEFSDLVDVFAGGSYYYLYPRSLLPSIKPINGVVFLTFDGKVSSGSQSL